MIVWKTPQELASVWYVRYLSEPGERCIDWRSVTPAQQNCLGDRLPSSQPCRQDCYFPLLLFPLPFWSYVLLLTFVLAHNPQFWLVSRLYFNKCVYTQVCIILLLEQIINLGDTTAGDIGGIHLTLSLASLQSGLRIWHFKIWFILILNIQICQMNHYRSIWFFPEYRRIQGWILRCGFPL